MKVKKYPMFRATTWAYVRLQSHFLHVFGSEAERFLYYFLPMAESHGGRTKEFQIFPESRVSNKP